MITAVHQIEITSRCNLRCRYCAHPKMTRPKQDMSRETFELALDFAAYFVRKGTQRELNLAGIGESTMHPDFIEFVGMARRAVGPTCALILATNGLLMTREMAQALVPFKPKVWVSLHRPEKAGPAVEALRDVGLLSGVSADPSVAAINWAGQVQWHVSAPPIPCEWLLRQRVFIDSCGLVRSCCLDGESDDKTDGLADGVLGRLAHFTPVQLEACSVTPYKLCESCSYYDAFKAQQSKEAA